MTTVGRHGISFDRVREQVLRLDMVSSGYEGCILYHAITFSRKIQILVLLFRAHIDCGALNPVTDVAITACQYVSVL